MQNLYEPPFNWVGEQAHFDGFFEKLLMMCQRYGTLEELCVCDSSRAHIRGNVYARYTYEVDAILAKKELHGQMFEGRLVFTTFIGGLESLQEIKCKQPNCMRGQYCAFVHMKTLSDKILDK